MATPNPDVVIIESDPKHQNDGTSLLPKNSIYNGDDGTDICEPRSLDAGRSHTVDAVISLCMIATAVPLLGFAVIIGRLHGKPVGGGRSWDIIQFIYTKLATLFPILFAAVVGLAVKRIAARFLERGVSLGLLEQLMGSLTVGGTVSIIWGLRSFNITAVLLLVLWSFSPLGSQSSLQMIYVRPVPITTNLNVAYLDTIISTTMADAGAGTAFADGDLYTLPALDAMYNTCLLQSDVVRNSSMDLWGNVKIPDLERSIVDVGMNASGWVDFAEATNISYSSLLGIPLALGNPPPNTNTTFYVETTYLSVSCTNITMHPGGSAHIPCNEISNVTFYGSTVDKSNVSWSLCLNGFYGFEGQFTGYGHVASLGNGTVNFPARTLLFQAAINTGNDYPVAYCPVTTAYVESAVLCAGDACAVTAMRPSQLPHPEANLTDLSFSAAFSEFSANIAGSVGSYLHDATSSPTEFFLADPDQVQFTGISAANWSSLTTAGLGFRLQQVVNTYWYGSFGPNLFIGRLNASEPSGILVADGERMVPQDVYTIRWAWWAIYTLSTIILIISGVVGLVLGWVNKGPEVLGYCSSLVARSPYVQQGYGFGSTMGGVERARVFGQLQVRMADVEFDEEVGFVALTHDNKLLRDGILKSDRLYR